MVSSSNPKSKKVLGPNRDKLKIILNDFVFNFQIHAPYSVLRDYSEILKLRMPMKVSLIMMIMLYSIQYICIKICEISITLV